MGNMFGDESSSDDDDSDSSSWSKRKINWI